LCYSYIYDPSVPVEVPGRKRDPTSSSLYQSHRFPEEADHIPKKQGFHNLAYSTHPSPTKLDIDNNHINRLHANIPGEQIRSSPAEGDPSLYILQPEGEGTPIKVAPTLRINPPIQNEPLLGTEPGKREDRFRDSGLGVTDGTEGSDGYPYGQEDEDEDRKSRLASTPDTADEESVLSVDIHTSSTSLSSADAKLMIEDREKEEPSIERGEQERAKEMDCVSVTDSMVAEALAALDAATAGEDSE
uniref:Zgc:194930 n=1 Tax=Sinocyclocheilus anshuiensis TaxID=1608454 RepID=A0A671QQ25_9TELE